MNTTRCSASQIERIGHVAFQAARERGGKLCSVGKANVLEVMKRWREVMTEVGRQYPDMQLRQMYVDAASMAPPYCGRTKEGIYRAPLSASVPASHRKVRGKGPAWRTSITRLHQPLHYR